MSEEHYRRKAEECRNLAEQATDGPSRKRFMVMADAWQALAEAQRWLDDRNVS
jgi:hypothetical protein